jgi:hypothetical protein
MADLMDKLRKDTKEHRVRLERELRDVTKFERTINPTARPRKKRSPRKLLITTTEEAKNGDA